jgi:RNA polymerase sigma-70 factor (ECF subfamily)
MLRRGRRYIRTGRELPCLKLHVRLVPDTMTRVDILLPDLATLLEVVVVQSVRAFADGLRAQMGAPAVPMPDEADVQQARRGDPDAYRRLVERHQDYVAGILWRFSRDRQVHEELVQDTFVEAYLSLNTYHAKAPLAHWLARIATRVGYRYWKEKARQQKREPLHLDLWGRASEDDGIVSVLEPSRAAELLHELLGQLPPRDRLVLTLRYLDQCDVAQTAERTGWTRTMVKVQTMRARKRLRKLVERSGMELT